jgi:hypothetical protein
MRATAHIGEAPAMTELDPEKLAYWRRHGVGVISRRTRDLVTEGRAHPDSGLPFKTVTDEANTDVTEHSRPGSGVTDRQDVLLRPETIKVKREELGI